MSIAAANAFLKKVVSDEGLRAKAEQAATPEAKDQAFIDAGVFVFTPDELLEAQSESEQKGMFGDLGRDIGNIVDHYVG